MPAQTQVQDITYNNMGETFPPADEVRTDFRFLRITPLHNWDGPTFYGAAIYKCVSKFKPKNGSVRATWWSDSPLYRARYYEQLKKWVVFFDDIIQETYQDSYSS